MYQLSPNFDLRFVLTLKLPQRRLMWNYY